MVAPTAILCLLRSRVIELELRHAPLIFLLTKRHEKWDEYEIHVVSQASQLLLLFVARFEMDHGNVELT